MLPKIDFTTTSAYKYLTDHFITINETDLKQLFIEDADRFKKFSILFEDILFDFSKNNTCQISFSNGLHAVCFY